MQCQAAAKPRDNTPNPPKLQRNPAVETNMNLVSPTSWQSIVETVAKAVLNAVGGTRSPPTPQPTPAPTLPTLGISATGLTAFVNFAGPIIRVVEGKGTLADDVAAANAVMEAVATIDPAAVPIISLIEMAEPTFELIAGLVKSGAIQGGYPDIIGEENSTNFRDR
jgi:hypothetical protein